MIPNKRPLQPNRWLDFSKIVVDNKDMNKSINDYYRTYPNLTELTIKEVPSEKIDKINGDLGYLYDNCLKDRGYTHNAGRMSYNPLGETVFRRSNEVINRPMDTRVMKGDIRIEIDPYGIAKEYGYGTKEYPTVYHYLYSKYSNIMMINSPEYGGDYSVYVMLYKVVEELKRRLISGS